MKTKDFILNKTINNFINVENLTVFFLAIARLTIKLLCYWLRSSTLRVRLKRRFFYRFLNRSDYFFHRSVYGSVRRKTDFEFVIRNIFQTRLLDGRSVLYTFRINYCVRAHYKFPVMIKHTYTRMFVYCYRTDLCSNIKLDSVDGVSR